MIQVEDWCNGYEYPLQCATSKILPATCILYATAGNGYPAT